MNNLSNKEQADLVKAFWNDYGRWIAIAILVGLLAGFGWRWYSGHKQSQQIAASALYTDLLQSSLSGDGEKAVDAVILGEFKQEYPNSTYRIFADMFAARQAVNKGQLKQAEMRLVSLLSSRANPALLDLVKLHLARVYLMESKNKKALITLNTISAKKADLMGLLANIERTKVYLALNQSAKAKQLMASVQAQAKSNGVPLPGWVFG